MVPDRRVDTVFFGGGTPSLMHPDTVAALLAAIRKSWPVADDVEISLEANPTSVEAGRFQGYADAGVNRVSMGIQSLRDNDLRSLGRLHTVAEARQAFDIAKQNFSNVSFDLIYARQNQSLSDWQAELREAIDMAVDHLSLYQLTIEPGTRFAELRARGRLLGVPDTALATDMYHATQDVCADNGLSAYEISNHTRSGAECRHNLIYWRYGDYVGVGPGAHGRLSVDDRRLATVADLSPESWLSQVEKSGSATRITEIISNSTQLAEYVMMSLRLSEGCDLARARALCPEGLNADLLQQMATDGFLKLADNRMIATENGRLVLNALLREILGS